MGLELRVDSQRRRPQACCVVESRGEKQGEGCGEMLWVMNRTQFTQSFFWEMQIKLESFFSSHYFWCLDCDPLNELLCQEQATWTLRFVWVMFESNQFLNCGLLAGWYLYIHF